MVAHPTMFGGPCTGPASCYLHWHPELRCLFSFPSSHYRQAEQIFHSVRATDQVDSHHKWQNSILSKCLMWTMSSQRRIFISAKCLGRTVGLWRWDTELHEVCCLTFPFVCCSFTIRLVGLSDWRAGCRLRGFQIWPGLPNWPSRPTHRMSGDFWEIPSTRVTNSHISPSCPSRGVSLVIIISPGPPA